MPVTAGGTPLLLFSISQGETGTRRFRGNPPTRTVRGTMSTTSQRKIKISFPNTWAVNSFLLRIKRSNEWELFPCSSETHFKATPKGSTQYILIGLNKSRSNIEVDLNAERLEMDPENVWRQIYEFASRYRS